MNVLKPHLRTTVTTLLDKGVGQREIKRKTGVDRKTIRRYGRLYDLLPPPDDSVSKSPTPEGVPEGVATGSGYKAAEACPLGLRAASGVDRGAVAPWAQCHGDLPGPGGTLGFHASLQ